jgi:alcohol dehydrogenase
VDVDDNRLSVAKELGATQIVNSRAPGAAEKILAASGGRGVDTAIEAVGIPETFELCQMIIAPGAVIANIGVHGKCTDLHLERLWSQNISITTRLVDTVTTPQLMRSVISGRLRPKSLITHHFKLTDIMQAYDTFAHAAENRTLKVVIDNGGG